MIVLGVKCLIQAICLSCQSDTKKSALIGVHHTTGSVATASISTRSIIGAPFVLRLSHCGNNRLQMRQTFATTICSRLHLLSILGQACRHNKAELLQLSQQSILELVHRWKLCTVTSCNSTESNSSRYIPRWLRPLGQGH